MENIVELRPEEDLAERAEILNFLRLHFPINELTNDEWEILESVVNLKRNPLVNEIKTFRFSETIEYCSDNEISLIVTRFIEIDPNSRNILLRKTARPIPIAYPEEMYFKRYSNTFLKI